MKHLQNVRYAVAAVSALAVIGFAADAKAQTNNFDADVTVQNALTLTEDTPLNFGTIAAIRHTAQTASVVMPTTGVIGVPTTSGAPAYIAVIDTTGSSAAHLTVEDGAPGATINVNIPVVSITNPTFGGNSFALGTWRYRWNGGAEAAITPGVSVPVTFDNAFNAGVNDLFIGATLSTTTGAVAYGDGQYDGSFDVTLSY